MKTILILFLLTLCSFSFSQELKGSEKFSKNILKAIKSDKGLKKVIISHQDMNSLIDMMFSKYMKSVEDLESEDTLMAQMMDQIKASVEETKSDSAYKVITNKMRKGVRKIRAQLIESDINPSEIKFISEKHIIDRAPDYDEELTQVKLFISFNTGKDTDTMQIAADECLFYNGNWFLGDRIRLVRGSIDVSEICRCIQDEGLDGCDALKADLENSLESMSEEEVATLMEEVMLCIEESAEEEYKEEESYDFSQKEIETVQDNLAAKYGDYCPCAIHLFEEELPDHCTEQLGEITTFISGMDQRQQELHIRVLEKCLDD